MKPTTTTNIIIRAVTWMHNTMNGISEPDPNIERERGEVVQWLAVVIGGVLLALAVFSDLRNLVSDAINNISLS